MCRAELSGKGTSCTPQLSNLVNSQADVTVKHSCYSFQFSCLLEMFKCCRKIQGCEVRIFIFTFETLMCLPYSRVVRSVKWSLVSSASSPWSRGCSCAKRQSSPALPCSRPHWALLSPSLRAAGVLRSTAIAPQLLGSSAPELLERTAHVMSVREKTSGSLTRVIFKF